MNYQIITDLKLLTDFVEWLPDLQETEKYYLSLFARKKYCTDLVKSSDKTQLKRFVSTKERIIEKISQLEIPIDRFNLGDSPAPQQSLVVYITVNPRCMQKATKMMGKMCWDLMESKNFNIHAEALSCIQKSKSRTCFVDFDIDTKDIDMNKEWLNQNIGESYKILETRGGYHLLINPKMASEFRQEFDSKNWYKVISDKYPVDQTGDQLLPVPGTSQGGFTPRFI